MEKIIIFTTLLILVIIGLATKPKDSQMKTDLTSLPKYKVVEIYGSKIAYWDNQVKSDKIILLLSPSSEDGRFFIPYIKLFDQDSRIIIPDYPGRGESEELPEYDTIPLVAKYISGLSEKLNLKNITVVGVSFGSAVANEMVKRDDSNIKNVILVAPGEYFDHKWEVLLHAFFLPAKLSENVRKIYKVVINDFSPVFNNLPNKNLKSILEQWLSIIDYKIDDGRPTQVPVLLVHLKRDKIIERDSITRLHKFYPNYREIFIDVSHREINKAIQQTIPEINKLVNQGEEEE